MSSSIAVRESARGFFAVLESATAWSRRATETVIRILLASAVVLLPLTAHAASSTVVISQVYGAGGNSGATYQNDYIELFNLSNASVSVDGWSVQYTSATGTGNFASNVTPLTGTIPAGSYYLVALAGGTTGAVLPKGDAIGTINMAAGGGKVILANTTTGLACNGSSTSCTADQLAQIVDLVGQGTANYYEGNGAAPAPGATTADVRADGGCTDTDNNALDFTAASPNPHNSASAYHPCAGSGNSTNPVASGSAAPSFASPGDAVVLTVTIIPGANPSSTFASSGSVVADLTAIGGSATQAFTYSSTDGSGNLIYGYRATIGTNVSTGAKSLPVAVTDDQSRTAAATSIAFSVVNAMSLSIMDIQGHGARSSYAGSGNALGATYIKTPAGAGQNIVTAVGPKGFFMQDTVGDGDVTTSDGIYVYTGNAPSVSVGDLVSVVGRVQEFGGSTEIAGGPSYTVTGHDASQMPAPYDLSMNLPSTDPSTGTCVGGNSTVAPPSADGQTRNDGYQAANFACLDGMLVTMSQGIVNAPTYTTANSGITPSPTSPNTGFFAVAGGPRSFRKPGILGSDANRTASIPTFWGNPELIQVYFSGLGVAGNSFPKALNQQAGGIYDGGQKLGITGVIQGYQATGAPDPTYEIYPRSGSDIVLLDSPSYPVAVPDPIPGKLTIGTQNMLHFFNNTADGADTSQYTDTCQGTGSDDTCPTAAEYANRLKKMSLQIRTVLKAPLVLAAQEVENLKTAHDLATQIQTDDPSIIYHPYLIPGNDPGGINVSIFVREGVSVNSVTQIYANWMTSACSTDGTTCLLNDRPPLLLDAVYQGYRFRVLAIYDRSLNNLGVKDYVGQKRREEAEQVAFIVQALQTTGATMTNGNAQQDANGTVTNGSFSIPGDATIPLIILGDFNAYEFSDGYVDVAGTIMGTVDTDPTHSVYPPTANYVAPSPALFDTGSAATPANHYSYNYQGLLQEIDHVILTSAGHGDFVSIAGAHGNADVSIASLALVDPTTPMRTSDHDGQVVTLGYVVTPDASAGGAISPATVQTVSSSLPVVFTVTPDAGNDASVTDTCGADSTAMGAYDASTNTYTLPAGVNHDCQVGATFGSIPTYAVTTTVSGTGGTISAPAQSPVVQGGSTTFTVTPLSGYAIGSVAGDTCTPSAQADSTWTTGPVTAACTITATFTANPVNGVCGADNGQTLSTAPTNLCTSGTPTTPAGNGWWTWSCQGSNGGTTVNCSANAKSGSIAVLGVANGDNSPSVEKGTDFGHVTVGTQSAHGFTISNAGVQLPNGGGLLKLAGSSGGSSSKGIFTPSAVGDLTINGITSSNPAFAVSGGTGTIAQGGSTTFAVTFSATSAGSQNAMITVHSNDAATPSYTFAVTALAIAAVTPPAQTGTVASAPALDAKSLLLLAGMLALVSQIMLRRRKLEK
jgi:predicted extracellular nuclease